MKIILSTKYFLLVLSLLFLISFPTHSAWSQQSGSKCDKSVEQEEWCLCNFINTFPACGSLYFTGGEEAVEACFETILDAFEECLAA